MNVVPYTKALTASAIAGLLRPLLADVNIVSAPGVAKERGIAIDEVTRAADADYQSLITLFGRNATARALGLRHCFSRRKATHRCNQWDRSRRAGRARDDLRQQ